MQFGDVLADSAGFPTTADEDAAFEVGFHGAAGEVGAADESDPVIDHQDLGVQRRTRGRALARWPAKPQGVQAGKRQAGPGVGDAAHESL